MSSKETTDPRWHKVSAEFTENIDDLVEGRTDLIVTVGPGAAGREAAYMQSASGEIRVDSERIAVDPDRWAESPVLRGRVIHEAAHASHSLWDDELPVGTDPKTLNTAMALEESRVELRQVTRRPQDRDDLAANARTNLERAAAVIQTRREGLDRGFAEVEKARQRAIDLGRLADFPHFPSVGSVLDPAEAANVAALVLARADAGILSAEETSEVREEVLKAIGPDMLGQLERVWREAHKAGDRDQAAMLRAGARWRTVLRSRQVDMPQQHMGAGTPGMATESGDSGESDDSGDGGDAKDNGSKDSSGKTKPKKSSSPSAPQEKKTPEEGTEQTSSKKGNGREAKKPTAEKPKGTRAGSRPKPKDLPKPDRPAERREEAAARRQAAAAIGGYWSGKGKTVGTREYLQGYRLPTAGERILGRKTRRALQAAYIVDKTRTRVPFSLPPGRMNPREAMKSDAQRALGLLPTAEPWRRKVIRREAAPPLKVAILQDLSGSQAHAATAATSGAWSLANAVSMLPDSQVMMIGFVNDEIPVLINPGVKLPGVPVAPAGGGDEVMSKALSLAEARLHLMNDTAARLVVVIGDGEWPPDEKHGWDRRFRRLVDAGVKVLWVHTDPVNWEKVMRTGRHPQAPGHKYTAADLRLLMNSVVPTRRSGASIVYTDGDARRIPQIICDAAVKVLSER